jgi:hypothetical protein
MRGRRALTVVLLILGGAAYFTAGRAVENKEKRASVSVYNRRAGGVSVYADFMNKVAKGSARLRKSPFLYVEDFEGSSAVVILSPTNEITAREGSVVADYVEAGGTLILGLHDPLSAQRARHLLENLKGGANIVEDTHFRNGQSVLLTPKADTFVFKAEETYELYSSVLLDRNECRGGNFDCYVKEFSHGKGKVVLLAGLPFFGNVLIGRYSNKQAALRMAAALPSVQIDEYHHFFTDQTIWNLMAKPAFSIPIIGSILGALLLLAFGHTEFHERSQDGGQVEKPPRTLHGLSESIVFRVFEKGSAYPAILRKHREFLARLFPGHRKDLAARERPAHAPDQKQFLLEARRLLMFHKKWMKGDR